MSTAAAITTTPTDAEFARIDASWRAANYPCVCMIYLRDNPLLRAPLAAQHVKERLLGHFRSDSGQTFVYAHINRLITTYDLDVIYVCGPGHGIWPRRRERRASARRPFL